MSRPCVIYTSVYKRSGWNCEETTRGFFTMTMHQHIGRSIHCEPVFGKKSTNCVFTSFILTQFGPYDSFLFDKLQDSMWGTHFADVEAVKVELARLLNAIKNALQAGKNWMLHRIAVQGEYFEWDKIFLSCVYTCKHCVREHVRKIYFSMIFWRIRAKWWTNHAGSYMKIVGEIGKPSHKT